MRPVTRSMEATDGGGVGHVAGTRRSLPSGWWGMGLFLATEATLFGSMISSYFYLRFTSTEWPQGGLPAPSVALPLALTAGLVLTIVPVVLAVRSARRGAVRAAWLLLLLAFLAQAGYLAVQIVSFLSDLEDFGPSTNAYGSIYFTLLFTHHAHVALGLLLDAWFLMRLAGGLTNYRLVGLRTLALYWYVVAAIAVLVVATQVSAA